MAGPGKKNLLRPPSPESDTPDTDDLDDEPAELLNPKIWKDKEPCSAFEEITWVFDNIQVKVKPKDSPSPGAWTLLQRVRSGDIPYKEFLKNLYSKVVPTRKQISEEEEYSDHGGPIISALNELDAIADEADKPVLSQVSAHAEGSEVKPGLQTQDAEVGGGK